MTLIDGPVRLAAKLAQRLTSYTIGVNTRVVVPYAPLGGAADSYAVGADRSAAAGELVPPPELWVGYGRSDEEYLHSGRAHVSTMAQLLVEHGHRIEADSRILDFGCAAGRMTRFIPDQYPGATIWGVDVDASSIEWACRNLSALASFATTTQYPHLPFEDGFFDFVYAGSVFSHIDDLATAWFLELRRIVRPHGSLFLTVQDETTVQVVLDQSFQDHWLQRFRFPKGVERTALDLLEKKLLSFSYNRGAYPHVYYNSDALTASMRRHFSDVRLHPKAYGYQSALICTK
jgi:SAM-dependent methyltransferase